MAKNDNITKDPSAAGRKGGKKSGERLKTRLKKTGKWDEAEGLFEQIVLESMKSKSPSVRRRAAKDFGEFIKPKKREQKIDGKLTIDDIILEDDDQGTEKSNS